MGLPPHPCQGMRHPSREIVAEYLSYDPQTGIFRWVQMAGYRCKAGEIAGTIRNTSQRPAPHPSRSIQLFGIRYPASHIAWLLITGKWPAADIDHRNHNATDDRWKNLRLATPVQNAQNTRVRADNTSGYKGVHPYKRGVRNQWVAQIGKQHIGYFRTAEAAALAYDRKAQELYGEFAHLNLLPYHARD